MRSVVHRRRTRLTPVGSTGPGRDGGGVTVAVYVVLTPTLTLGDASSEVELESGPTTNVWPGLTEPATIESGPGEKTALRLAVDAANDVEHATVAPWPLGVTGMFAHPAIGASPFSKVTVPDSAVFVVTTDVTVAINVTDWLVTARSGDTSRLVVLGNGPTGPTVSLVAGAVVGPASFDGVTVTLKLCPTSAADSVIGLPVWPSDPAY